ncbi:putative kinase [uncultured Defluviicoccus sp.]|uniref:Putative kinase n=1 Tax=metagenome TaxID=256318 RepID=A0A380TBT9_9ZZZZ|nr:putative kinase [uncultured Defluviicoccus sp.]
MSAPTLHFFCGKAGAGKSTRAKAIAAAQGALLLSEDVWLSRLYGDQIVVFDDYIRCSQKLLNVVKPLVADVLRLGQSVVMDFPANTRRRRSGFRSVFEDAGANHVLHVLQTPDALCLERIRQRNREMPEGASQLTEADYWHVTSFFEAPDDAEGFNMQVYAA